MHFPTLIVDNFFDSLDEVKKYANQLEYYSPENKKHAGCRTKPMHEVSSDFFEYITSKIIKLMYPHEKYDLRWNVEMNFTKINPKKLKYPGWAHQDNNSEFTAIIYLSDHECGTNICHPKNFFDFASSNYSQEQFNYYRNPNYDPSVIKKEDDKFEDTIIVKAKPNRLLIFDGGSWHRQQQFTEKDLNIKEDRLTLICFFHNISKPDPLKKRLVYPITEMKRV
jgi:hypothetical protein